MTNTQKHVSSFALPTPASSEFYAAIIDAIGTETFFARIAELVERHLVFDGLFVCLYSRNRAPISLGCFKGALNFRSGIENYLKYSYVINPVYRAFQNDVVGGSYFMSDLLPAGMKNQISQSDFRIWIDDQETIGYRTMGWPKNMTEALGLVWLSDNKMVELCFLNSQDGDQTQTCYAGLQAIYPALSSAMRKHFEVAAQDFDTSKADPNLEFRILDFGKRELTKREQTVVQLVLKGHSSNAIALILDISLPTVKTHRRNIYGKLQISSQVELFNLFVQKMMELGS